MNLYIFLAAFAILAAGCSEQRDVVIAVPADQSTPEQREKIDAVVDDISAILAAGGLKINLRQLPIVVTELPPEHAGICQWDSEDRRGIYIALDPSSLNEEKFDPTSKTVPWYYQYILHEIGHCYFSRGHEGGVFTLREAAFYFRAADLLFDAIPDTVMADQARILIPMDFRDYYVFEIAGRAKILNFADIQQWADVELRLYIR